MCLLLMTLTTEEPAVLGGRSPTVHGEHWSRISQKSVTGLQGIYAHVDAGSNFPSYVKTN